MSASSQSSTTECDNDAEEDLQSRTTDVTSPSVLVQKRARKNDGPRSNESKEEGENDGNEFCNALDIDRQASDEDKNSQVETVVGEDDENGADVSQKSEAKEQAKQIETQQETEVEGEQEVVKKQNKRRVPIQDFEKMVTEDEEASPKSKVPAKKRKEVDSDSDEEEAVQSKSKSSNKKMHCVVEIPAFESGDSDTEMEAITPVKRKPAKTFKRVPLAEKSSNVQSDSSSPSPAKKPIKKQVKKTGKQPAKKQVKKESDGSKAKPVRRRSQPAEETVERKPTRRQSDLREKASAKTSQQIHTITLVLPGRFEPACKKMLQNVMKDEEKVHEQDDVILMLDLFQR